MICKPWCLLKSLGCCKIPWFPYCLTVPAEVRLKKIMMNNFGPASSRSVSVFFENVLQTMLWHWYKMYIVIQCDVMFTTKCSLYIVNCRLLWQFPVMNALLSFFICLLVLHSQGPKKKQVFCYLLPEEFSLCHNMFLFVIWTKHNQY